MEYPITEYLVLWATSEKNYCFITLHGGMMEWWNYGIMGLADLISPQRRKARKDKHSFYLPASQRQIKNRYPLRPLRLGGENYH